MIPATIAQPLVPLVEAETKDAIQDPDVALMMEVSAGSDSAFAQLVQRHQRALVNFFTRMGAPAESEDLAQETFVRLYSYRRQYRPRARFSAFLYHLARNALADFGRKVARVDRMTTEFQNRQTIVASEAPDHASSESDIEAALSRLSPKLREVIVLNIYQGLRYQEISDALKIPLGTVKSRINLALTALKEMLHEK